MKIIADIVLRRPVEKMDLFSGTVTVGTHDVFYEEGDTLGVIGRTEEDLLASVEHAVKLLTDVYRIKGKLYSCKEVHRKIVYV